MAVPFLVLATALFATDAPPFGVRVDAAKHEIVFRLGPFSLPASPSGAEHVRMHHHGLDLPLYRFTLATGAWIRGFRVRLRDEAGRELPRELLHHINLIHLGRRQLTEPIFERTLAAGQETADVLLPKSVAVRLDAGAELAVLTAWSNQTGTDYPSVILELSLPYLSENTVPRPREVLPVVFDVGFRPGFPDDFDLDTGRTVHQREVVVPLDGRLLAIGGHLHNFGESLELVDAATGKVVVSLAPELDAAGRIVGFGRRIFGVSGQGLRLRAGHYRVVAVYHNKSGARIVSGGMAMLGGIFAPDDPRRWPALDRSSPVFVADAAGLDRIGWVTVAEKPAGGQRRP